MAEESQGFQWEGIDGQGKRISGMVKATDAKAAQQELRRMGIEVVNLKEKKGFSLPYLPFFSKKKKIKQAEILFFTRYLSTMMAAGLPIVQALEIISHDQENESMRSMVNKIKTSLSEGKTLSESFGKFPDQFSDLYCNLVKAGEKSGTLDKTLIRLGNYLERTENLKRKLKKALVYPIAILTVAMVVSLILLVFVVPQFQKMFESFGADLPVFTQMVVALSNNVRRYWWVILIILIVATLGLRHFIKASEKAQAFIDRAILKVYLIGGVTRKGIIARFTRTLATTLEAGMPIVEAMNAMPQIMGNRLYSKAAIQVRNDLVNGHQLSVAMASTKLFPNMAVQMISIGEASGRLSDMLNKVADYYEEEVNATVDNLSSLLEPVIMMILGVIVGCFIVAMYLPIFQIGSLF